MPVSGHESTVADSVTLVIPGLTGPLPSGPAPFPLPRLKVLETWLSRGRSLDGLSGEFETLLLRLFGVDIDDDAEPPAAALCRLGDGAPAGDGFWLRGDPVHLVAEQDKVYLLESQRLSLSLDEARDFAAEINALYGAEGWRLEVLDPHRWYLRAPDHSPFKQARGLRTTPTSRVLGEDIHPFLPRGEDGGRWRAVYNELQMLFHLSPVNTRREAGGEPVVNGLWLWGGGVLPERAHCPWKTVYSNEPMARGLGTLAGAEVKPVPAAGFEWLDGAGAGLVVLDVLREPLGRGDGEAFSRLLTEIEGNWLAPLDEALRSGRLATVELYSGNASAVVVDRRARRRWWRRRRPLSACMETSGAA